MLFPIFYKTSYLSHPLQYYETSFASNLRIFVRS